MVYIYIVLLVIYILLFFLSRKEEGRNPFRRMAFFLIRKRQEIFGKKAEKGGGKNWKQELYRKQLGNKLKTLHPSAAVQEQVREYYAGQYSVALTVAFAGVLLCLLLWFGARESSLLTEEGYLWRNSYGEGDVSVQLLAQIEGEEEEIFQYILEERKYTQEEAEKLFQKAVEILPEIILGNNESLEDVRSDLDLVTEIEGCPFTLSWDSSSYGVVNTDGTVENEELQEAIIVTLTAHFQYEKWEWDHQLAVQVNPAIYTHREKLRRRLEELLRVQEEQTGTREAMLLPDSVDSRRIVWKEIVEDGSGYLFMLALFAACMLYLGRGRELERKLEQRKKQLLLDYPEVVNKLALYMGAGMTIRNAFARMGEDYRRQQKERFRYVYEEILITCYELQSGRSEREAYDHFGKRCQVQAYRKLSTLLSQNIRKGSNDLLYMLRQEADQAFAERKNMARKLGEEAGTKLLLPMMMMLCIVMVIIMIPAYFSFMI